MNEYEHSNAYLSSENDSVTSAIALAGCGAMRRLSGAGLGASIAEKAALASSQNGEGLRHDRFSVG